MGLKGARKRLLPILQKELFKAFAQNDANRMPGSAKLSIGLTPHGQSLNSLVAEQKPGLSDILYIPDPQLHPAVSKRIPNDYRRLLVAPDENNVMKLVPFPTQNIGVLDRDAPNIHHLAIPRKDQLVPHLPEMLQVPKPRLHVVTREKIPKSV